MAFIYAFNVDVFSQLCYSYNMMKISTKSTYAIRALLQLARESPDKPVCLPHLAEQQHIPLPYLEQIFSKLRRAGLVESIRGPQGGYKLAKSPAEISFETIITALEGPLAPVLCSMPENRSPQCHEVDGCLSRVLCNELDGELSRILSRNNLSSFLGGAEKIQGVL